MNRKLRISAKRKAFAEEVLRSLPSTMFNREGCIVYAKRTGRTKQDAQVAWKILKS